MTRTDTDAADTERDATPAVAEGRRAAGVPAYEDVVGDYLRECFDARHDWQEFVTRTSKRIARETNLSPQKVREAMQELRGANAEGALAGFSVGRVTDAHRPNWKVERVDAEEDGGSA